MYLEDIAAKIKSYQTEVLSIHAVQAPIANNEFRVWGKEIAEFAKTLRAKVITVHPENMNKTEFKQDQAAKNIRFLNRLYNENVIFSVETFTGNRRVFTPDETVGFGLPMTLDIAHVTDNQKIWELLKSYNRNIVNIHLSAKGKDRHHLPIDGFCKEVVAYLTESGWEGNVILEYLPEFHDQMLIDIEILRNMAGA